MIAFDKFGLFAIKESFFYSDESYVNGESLLYIRHIRLILQVAGVLVVLFGPSLGLVISGKHSTPKKPLLGI
ncbi:hypothetical protein DZS_30360 [Dickeya ananatis]